MACPQGFQLIVLVLNLSWSPILAKARAEESETPYLAQYACHPPAEWAEIATAQQNAFNWLGWADYDLCDDLFVLLNEDVVEPNPDHLIAGLRGASTYFYLTVTRMHWQNDDWASYGLDAQTAAELEEANVAAAIVEGVINDDVRFTGLTVALDDPSGQAPRTRHLMILDAKLVPRHSYRFCDGDRDQYDNCLQQAFDTFDACNDVASNDFETCCVSNGLVGGLIGGGIGCVINKLKLGGVGGPVGVKTVLIKCALGALIGAALGIFECYNDYQGDKDNCLILYQLDRNNCHRNFCAPYPATPPLPWE